MVELLWKIPEHIGWVIVGALGTLSMVMLFNLGRIFVQMWKSWREKDNEEGED